MGKWFRHLPFRIAWRVSPTFRRWWWSRHRDEIMAKGREMAKRMEQYYD